MIEKTHGPDAEPVFNSLKGKTPAEAVETLRAQTEVAKPEQAVALQVAADRIEENTAAIPPEQAVSASEVPPPAEHKEAAEVEPAEPLEGSVRSIPSYMDEPLKDRLVRLSDKLADLFRITDTTEKPKAATPDSLREQDRQRRDDVAAIRKELLGMVSELPPGERGRFNMAIADAMNRPAVGFSPDGMYRRAMHVMMKMMDYADLVKRNELIAEIKKSMDKALESSLVDVEYKRKIERSLSRVAFRSLSAETRAQLMETREYIARGSEESKVPQDVVAQLDMLSKTNAKDLPMDTLQALRDRITLLSKLGRTMVKSREALYESEKAALAADLKSGEASSIEEIPIKASPGQEMTPLQRTAQNVTNKVVKSLNYAGKLGRSLIARDVVMDMMDGDAYYKGPVSRIFGGRVDLDYNAEMNLRRAFQAPLEQLAKANTYSTLEAERISIYAIAQEENGQQRLLDSGVTADVIAHVMSTITPKEMEFYMTARGIFDNTIYPALRKFMRDTYNVDVKQTENYWPFQRDPNLVEPDIAAAAPKAESGESVGFDEMATWKQLQQDFTPRLGTKAEKGMTIERVPEARGAVRLNALDVVDRHIRQTAHLLANQRDLKMMGEIARQDWFKAKYGRLGQDYILKFLDTIARDASPVGSTRTAWIDWLTRNTSVGVIGLRVLSQLKHLPNMAFSLKNVRPDYLVKGLTEQFTPEGRAFLQRNFAEISQRSGGEPAIADISNGGVWGKLQSGSFIVERGLDAMDARATVLGRYFQELEARGINHKGYATEPVNPEAQRMALLISRQTVTSPLRKDVPQALSRGTLTGGQMSWARAMFQFQNTMLRQMGYLKHDIYDLGLKKLNPNQFIFGSLAFMAMLTAETSIIEANKKLLGIRPQRRDEDSFAKEMAAEGLRRLPFAGNIAAAAMYGETGVPVVDFAVSGVKSAAALARDKNEFGGKLSPKQKKVDKALVASSVAEGLGIPGAGTAEQIYKSRLPKRENTDNIYR